MSVFHAEVNKHMGDTTALHMAAKYGFKDVVKSMVPDNCFEIDTRNEKNQTALFVAAQFGHGHVVEYLIHAGAQIDAKNDCGDATLHS